MSNNTAGSWKLSGLRSCKDNIEISVVPQHVRNRKTSDIKEKFASE
jgi:hypothetical protein